MSRAEKRTKAKAMSIRARHMLYNLRRNWQPIPAWHFSYQEFKKNQVYLAGISTTFGIIENGPYRPETMGKQGIKGKIYFNFLKKCLQWEPGHLSNN